MIVRDQLDRFIDMPAFPAKKIVSLVPSQTELLHDLGLEEEVIGITKFCVHPDSWFRSKKRVGGTKQVSLELIREMQPDLIIANKEENERDQVEALANEFPVWISNILTLDDATNMMRRVGALVGRKEASLDLVNKIFDDFDALRSIHKKEKPRVAYLIWNKPYMTVGRDTFIHHMLLECGFENVFAQAARYPSITIAELHAKNCQHILLSSEPFPFKEKHADELREKLRGMHVHLVDGELFSWYGSRLQYAPAYFRQIRELVLNA